MSFLDHEPLIRLASFFGVLLLLAGCEIIFPRRPRTMLRRSRWPANIGVAFIDTMVVRLIIPTGAVGFAMLVENHGWGMFHWLCLPFVLNTILSIVFLDLIIYGQHWVFH